MTTVHSTEHIIVEHLGQILLVTLNRPELLNAIAPETSVQLRSILQEIDQDPDVSVVVLTGAGRGFCAGGDAKTMAERHAPGNVPMAVYSRGRHLINAFLSVEKPIIAMVNGPAAGLGATMALFCDLVVMAEQATIGDRHVNMGLVAGDGGAVMWPLLIGPARAKEYLMTGRMMSGREAYDLGLVNRVVPLAELRDATFELAEEIAALPPFAVRASKASVNRYVSWMSNLVLETSLAWEKISMMTDDHQAALASYKDGVARKYTGQ